MKQVIIRHIINWVEENIDTGSGVSDLALSTGYSRRTLETWFLNTYGMSPGDYLFRRRMTRASVLLKLTILPVTEIALQLQYSNSQNFARAFRRFSGMTPTEYRDSELWNMSALQAPLIHSGDRPVDVTECILPARYLIGMSYQCTDSFLTPDNTFTAKLQREVIRLTRSGVEDIYLMGHSVASGKFKKSRDGLLDLDMMIGHLTQGNTNNARFIPSGKYCCYHFTSDWGEYCYCTKYLLFKIMTESEFQLQIKERDFCIHFIRGADDIDTTVSCEVFIPII